MPVAIAAEAVLTDGRMERSRRTRRTIVEALRTLHADGNLAPTATQIAEVSGVSRRTVWQHFEDSEELFIEAGRLDVELARSMIQPIDPALPLADRIASYCSQRAKVYESMAPTWRASRIREPFSPSIQASKKRIIAAAAAELVRTFAPEFAALDRPTREQLFRSAHVASLWATWESMRTELDLSRPQALGVMTSTLTTLFLAAAETSH